MSTSGSDSEPDAADQGWDDWEGDESCAVQSLFTAETFATVEEALAFDARQHNFDLAQYRTQVLCPLPLGIAKSRSMGVIRISMHARISCRICPTAASPPPVQVGAASQYDTIKLINWIRRQAAARHPPAEVVKALEAAAASSMQPWAG